MMRWAPWVLVAVVVALIAVAVAPRPERGDVTEVIDLTGARVTLYPAADPEAVWHFAAPRARYDTVFRDTTLWEVQDGERRVGGVVDFTLASEQIVIDRNDDLRTDRLFVHLVEDDLDVTMTGSEQRQVFVDQADARFEVPFIDITGEGFGESRYQDMRVSFDFTDFQAGGPGTVGISTFDLADREELP